jgi:hypothetical protein
VYAAAAAAAATAAATAAEQPFYTFNAPAHHNLNLIGNQQCSMARRALQRTVLLRVLLLSSPCTHLMPLPTTPQT